MLKYNIKRKFYVKKIIKKFKNTNESKINIKDFIKYLEKNIFLIVLTFIIIFLSHFYILNNSNIGIDTDKLIVSPKSNYNCLEIGRFGLILEKYFLHLDSLSLFFAETIAMFFLFDFSIVIYYLIYKATGKNIKYFNLIIPLIGLTSPIWAEQFIFTIQIAEITFSLLLTSISLIFILKCIFDKSNLSFIISSILLTIVFGTYQSFIAVGIAFVLFVGIIIFENKNESEEILKSFWEIILKLLF